MEYENFRNIKKTKAEKRILLVNPRRPTCEVDIPHMGLAILSSILKSRGHKVLVVDYQLIHNAPDIKEFMKSFSPDVIGISIITANTSQAESTIKEIREIDNRIPVISGGPHATLYPEDLYKNKGVDYIVVGESEPIIIDLVENAKREKIPVVKSSKLVVNPDDVPY